MPASLLVGVLNDLADLSAAEDSAGDPTDWLEEEVESLRAAGRIGHRVDFVHAYGLGLPSGTAEALEKAYHELADAGAALVIGPAIGDNALVLTPLAEKLRLPTLNWSGAERARGRYMFQMQVGSHEEEPLVIARHMAASGARRIGVFHEVSPAGTRQLRFLEEEAAALGMEIVAKAGLSPLGGEAEAIDVMGARADGIAYLGPAPSLPAVAEALNVAGWDGLRMMNTAGLCGYREDFAKACEGWLYVDTVSGANRTLQALMERNEAPWQAAPAVARGHDLGRIVAEAIARAEAPTREGLRQGLEHVKWLPAAQGEEGTLLGFGVQDRGALHGRFLVVRQWLDGRSVEVG
jgi:branched-chain amino acid transport system substrate-binding protein